MPDIAQLPVGHEFAPVHYQLRPEEVVSYLRAVGESNPIFGQQGLVPPTTLAAYALKGVLHELDLPPGAVHAAQEMSASRAITQNEAITFRAKVVQNALRGGWHFLSIDFSGTDVQGKRVLEGKSTVLIPSAGGKEHHAAR